MSRAVEGRVRVVFFATALPPLKVVTVTFATGVLVAVEVLRVLRFFGVVAFGVAGTGDLTGIRINSCVYPFIIQKKGLTKTPL